MRDRGRGRAGWAIGLAVGLLLVAYAWLLLFAFENKPRRLWFRLTARQKARLAGAEAGSAGGVGPGPALRFKRPAVFVREHLEVIQVQVDTAKETGQHRSRRTEECGPWPDQLVGSPRTRVQGIYY